MNTWTLRSGDSKDAALLLDLWLKAGATRTTTDSLDDVQRMLDAGAVLVAEARGQIVGSIFGVFDGWRANIYRLVVLPSYRRQGIARALVAEVEKRLMEQGARRFSAIVEKDHPLAMGFWANVGYASQPQVIRFIANR